MNEILRNACMIMGLSTLSACQVSGPAHNLALEVNSKPVTIIASIAHAMQACWFSTTNQKFRKFRLANEANSYAGKPRLLLVPKSNPQGLPSLVVQAEKSGDSTSLQAYGPLLESNLGQGISSDLKRWATGNHECTG